MIVGLLWLLTLAGWHLRASVSGWSDLASYLLPKYQYVAERLHEGALPLWNPWEFCGLPLLASLQPGVFYPPVIFFYSVSSGESAHVAFFFFHLAIGALGTLLLMRQFGYGPWPSLLGSLWVTQPMWLVRSYDHPNISASICWIPWLILLSRRCVLAPNLRAATGLAIVATLQFLAGYPPVVFATTYLLLIGVPFWLFEAHRRGESLRTLARSALTLFMAGGLCLLLAAAQLLPTAELLALTERQRYAGYAHDVLRRVDEGSRVLFAAGVPRMTTSAAALDFWNNFGPALMAFALLALVVDRRRVAVWYLLAAVALCGLLPYSAYLSLPPYGWVRWALEWHGITPMMAFMLAGCGIGTLIASSWLTLRAAAALSFVAVVASLGWNWRMIDGNWLRRPPPEPLSLPAWTARDCGPDDQRFRAFWPAGQSSASLLAARIRSIGGYESSLLPARSNQLVDTLGIGNGIPLSNWRWTVSKNRTVAARMGLRCIPPAPRYGLGFQAYSIQDAQPRARVVRQARFAGSSDESLRLIRESEEGVVLETAPEALPGGTCTGAAGTAAIVHDAPEEVRIATNAPCAAYLVLADTKFPGWRATLDGAAVPILTADFAFRAVRIPAGEHEVAFQYAPWTVPAGIATSLVGIVVAVGLILLPRQYDPLWRTPAAPEPP